jgi:hypothetical protein
LLFGEEGRYGARKRDGYRGEIGLEVDQTITGRGTGGCHGPDYHKADQAEKR